MREVSVGRIAFLIAGGEMCRIRFDGVEVLRRVSYPVRDGGWGTCPVETVSENLVQGDLDVRYERRFAARDGRFSGVFRAEVSGAGHLSLAVDMDAPADLAVNRAGFTLLHPLRGVAGEALSVTHSDGTRAAAVWPAAISPSQPVYDIAGLEHAVSGVQVAIAMTGEVFEMEDQRNWTDASYKTYCRPLGWPLPFALGPDAPVRQKIEVRLAGRGAAEAAGAALRSGVVPQVAVAMEQGLAETVLTGFPVQLRVRAGDRVPEVAGPVQLEVVVNEQLDGLAEIAARCAALDVVRVTVLSEPYLKSHQPEGPWPTGPTPMEMAARARAFFPDAAVGGGMFTNFTEFNRCRPDALRVDFVTWGGTAIVHAADDLSVIETLEALPHVFASGRGVARGKPMNLGLFTIGMRSNPYAADCVPNPEGARLAMVRDDPRQGTRMAACFAAGVLAAAVAEGVSGLALAMTDGPLGAVTANGVRPVYHVLRFAQAMLGQVAQVGTGDCVRITTDRGGIVAVLAGEATLPAGARGWLLNENSETAARGADWLETPPQAIGGARLQPFDLAFLTGETA